MHRDACQRRPLRLQSAVELRLGEKRAGQLLYLVGSAQLLDLTFKFLHSLDLTARNAFAHACINLRALDPFVQRLRHAANLGGYRLNRSPQRRVLASMVLHRAYSALTHFR